MKMRAVAVLGLAGFIGFWGCGGAVDARISSAKSRAPAAAVAAPASATQAIARDYETERLREVTDPLTVYPLTLAEGVQVNVESIAPPKLESFANAAGGTYTMTTVKLSADEAMLVVYNPLRIDMGSSISQTVEKFAGADKKATSSSFALAIEGGRPIPTWEVLFKSAQRRSAMRLSMFYLGTGTVICLFHAPGFIQSYASIMRKLAASAHSAQDRPAPMYMALSVMKVSDVALGFQEYRVDKLPEGGYSSATTRATFWQGQRSFSKDYAHLKLSDENGAFVESSSASSELGNGIFKRVLKRHGLGQLEYEVTEKGIVDRGIVTGNLTSELIDARSLRDWMSGNAASISITELAEKPWRVVPTKIRKEGVGVAVFESADGTTWRCEVNDQGICARKFYASSGLEIALVSSSGEMPRLAGARK